jgi:glucan phosphorylase
MSRSILSYAVVPSFPKELQCLQTIAYYLLWVWAHEPMELFMRIDLDLWELTNLNPLQMLGMIKQEQLNVKGDIDSSKTLPMQSHQKATDGVLEFTGTIKLETSGRMGHTVRVLLKHPDIVIHFERN